MLSWAGSEVPGLPDHSPETRRAHVERQQTLWPGRERGGPAPRLWENLDGPDRTRVAAVLARLIAQALRRDRTERGKEGRHEL